MSDALNYYLNFSLSFHLSSPLPNFNVAWLLTKCPLIAANIALGKSNVFEMNYKISVYYTEWGVIDHPLRGGVPTVIVTHRSYYPSRCDVL